MNEWINEWVNNNNDNGDGDDNNNGGVGSSGNENNDNDDAQKSMGKELNILKHSDKKPALCKKA